MGLGIAVELAGFGAYIPAAKAAAILAFIGGKASRPSSRGRVSVEEPALHALVPVGGAAPFRRRAAARSLGSEE